MYEPKPILRYLENTLIPTDRFQSLNLTPKQEQALLLAINGYPEKDIAAKLGITDCAVGKRLLYTYKKIASHPQFMGKFELFCRDTNIASHLLREAGFLQLNKREK